MARRNLVVLFVSTVLIGQAVAVSQVEIYYETHCPDSQNIMKAGVQKSLDMLDEVDFVLVPYGKAETKGEGQSLSFQCQHGQRECDGNTYHACAIDMYYKEKKKEVLKFAICSMSYYQEVLAKLEQCATKNGLDYGAIRQCATTQQGKELLAQMGEKTKTAANKLYGRDGLNFVPTTFIDGEARIDDSYNDLRKAICFHSKQKPSKCEKKSG